MVLEAVLCPACRGADVSIRDTARVLGISPTTVIEELKKTRHLVPVNEALLEQLPRRQQREIVVRRVDEAEMGEMWSFVGKKKQEQCVSISTYELGLND